jgi:hypothetical protein
MESHRQCFVFFIDIVRGEQCKTGGVFETTTTNVPYAEMFARLAQARLTRKNWY